MNAQERLLGDRRGWYGIQVHMSAPCSGLKTLQHREPANIKLHLHNQPNWWSHADLNCVHIGG